MFSGGKIRIEMDPMAFGFTVGSLIMSSILFYQRRFIKCTIIEITTIILISICLIVWVILGSYVTFIFSVSSETIIGVYLIIQTFKYPKVKYNLTGYIFFVIVSFISIILTKAWTIAEVGFAVSEMILSSVILIPLIRKWRNEKENNILKK